MIWPTVISIAAVIVLGVPFTYYWFRWSDRWANAERKRFGPKDGGTPSENVRVIRDEPTDQDGR